MAALPSYARLLFSGYKEQRESAIMRTEMESGPPKQIKVRSRVMVTRPVSIMLMSLSDYQSFITWFSDTINEGADWFDFTDPVTNTVKSGRFVNGGLDAAPSDPRLENWVINGLQIETGG